MSTIAQSVRPIHEQVLVESSSAALFAAMSKIGSRRGRPDLRSEPRWVVHELVKVTPVSSDENDRSLEPTGETVSAFVRELSHHGIGFLHAHPFESSRIVVDLRVSRTERVSLLVELKWCKPLGDYACMSGGALMGVIEAAGKNGQ